jgi:hypothetical protein
MAAEEKSNKIGEIVEPTVEYGNTLADQELKKEEARKRMMENAEDDS